MDKEYEVILRFRVKAHTLGEIEANLRSQLNNGWVISLDDKIVSVAAIRKEVSEEIHQPSTPNPEAAQERE